MIDGYAAVARINLLHREHETECPQVDRPLGIIICLPRHGEEGIAGTDEFHGALANEGEQREV